MIGLRQIGSRPLTDALREHLKASITEPTLVVLDNFEHVLAAAPLVVDLIRRVGRWLPSSSPAAKILRVYGEREYPVPPLPVPAPQLPFGEARRNPAVALFTQRAEAAFREFRLTEGNADAVADDLPPPGRLAPCPRARGRAIEDISAGGDAGAAGEPARIPDRRAAGSAGAAADAAPHDRLELRAADAARSSGCSGGSPCSRAAARSKAPKRCATPVATSTSSSGIGSLVDKSLRAPRRADWGRSPLHDARDDPGVRPRAAARERRGD